MSPTGCRRALLSPRLRAGPGLLAIFVATHACAVYEPAKEYVESPAVAVRFPEPDVAIPTPAFRPGRADFTSHEEMQAFIGELGRQASDLRVRTLGRSQEGREIPLLVFARPRAAFGPDALKNGRPTVVVIGQQHGNEPAGGEAALALAWQLAATERAKVLDRVNVLIVPRANPDGAFHFARGLRDGSDVNRDHLLAATPEGRALARVFVEFQPDVVLDCHEFGVRTRWYEKFGALQGYDALVQYATVSNLPPALTGIAERRFREPLLRALADAGLTQSWYYASSYDMKDKVVSMGGVVPDTGRNIAGLRNAVSFLIETRGVGIGRAHYRRRVYTHLVAMNSMLDSAAQGGAQLLAELRDVRSQVAAAAGRGELVVSGAATPTRHTLRMLDPESGEPKTVEVDWRDALQLQVRLQRSRPYGYLLPASEQAAAGRLRALGATVLRIDAVQTVAVERYRITSREEARKDDVRRNDEDGAASVVRITTATEPAELTVRPGDFYVPLDQPLANVIGAALEPETQSSFPANRLLSLPDPSGAPVLPLYRVPRRPDIAATVWTGAEP